MTPVQSGEQESRKPGLRVTVVCGGLLSVGGGETYLLELFKGLPTVDFRLVAPAETAFLAGLRHRPNVSWVSWSPSTWFDVKSAYTLYRGLRRAPVDLVHVNDARALVHAGIVCSLLGLPVIRVVQIPAYYYADSHLRHLGYTFAERMLNHYFTSAIIYLSSRVRREAIALGVASPENSRVIPQGVVLNHFKGATSKGQRMELRAEFGTHPDDVVITYVGRLAPEKQVPLLVEAFSCFASKYPLARLWIVGDGPERGSVSECVQRLGLEGRTRLLGFREDVNLILRASDIFALPSAYEAGAPMAVLEAMANSLPCVTTDVGECANLLDREAGIVISDGHNRRALGQALEHLVANPAVRKAMGQAARQRVLEYDINKMCSRILGVYRGVTGGSSSGGSIIK